MTTTTPLVVSGLGGPADPVAEAERRLYDAEVALHIAHQSHMDEWIAAAADSLHEAVLAHRAAVSAMPRGA